MSETDPRQEDLQKSLETSEATPPESNDLESSQSQLLSQELQPSTTEVNIEQLAHLDEVESVDKLIDDANLELPNSDNEVESIDKLTGDSSIQSLQEVSLINPHDTEITLSYQESPLTLERIYHELKFMRESMQMLQTSVEFIREEVAELKQEIITTNLKTLQVNQKRKQAQSSTNLNYNKVESTQNRSKKLDFNTMAFLQQNGEEKLRKELETKANTELIKIIRSEGIKSGKDVKNLEREEMIQEIIFTTKRRLQQGSAFLKD